MTNGYDFYFKDGENVLAFPITPSSLSIKVGSNNKVITLIGEGDINVLKSPSLIEVEFEARFPMRWYPFSRREIQTFDTYFNTFKELKEQRKSFRFIVARRTPGGKRTWDTNLLVALEDFTLEEDAGEGDDVIISFKLKQFKEYGVKKLQTSTVASSSTTSTSTTSRPTEKENTSTSSSYTVVSGDNLWAIAKKYYGNGTKWKLIYEANKNAIESEAKRRGLESSSNGHWIFPGTQLIIPSISTANSTTQSTTQSTDLPKPPKKNSSNGEVYFTGG